MNLSDVLTAILSGLLAVLFAEAVRGYRERSEKSKNEKFAALNVALALESYANICASLITESEIFIDTEGYLGNSHENLPELSTIDVDWRSFHINKVERVTSFRTRIEDCRDRIAIKWDNDGEALELLREKCGSFGIEALELAKIFRLENDINLLDTQSYNRTYLYLGRKRDEYAQNQGRIEDL